MPTRDVLEVVTERLLQKEKGLDGVYNVLKAMLGNRCRELDFMTAQKECIDALIEQFPILKKIKRNSKRVFADPYISSLQISNWVEKQIIKIGSKELDVTPIKADK